MGTAHLFRNAPEVIPVAAGAYIFRKGEPATAMYMIIEGEVDLLLGATVVETAGEGSFIGEMALIDAAPRSASARARTACRVFPIDEARFQTLVQRTPFFALQVMKTLADRLRRMDARMGTKPKAKKKSAAGRKKA
jgi:CRP/FNR family transcriptional regulator, cyclic AMP receptor protein